MTALLAAAGICWLLGLVVCVVGMIRRPTYGVLAVGFVLFCAGLYPALSAVMPS